LRECKSDPGWERAHNIVGVICRECGKNVRTFFSKHLSEVHGLPRLKYLRMYRGAPWKAPAGKRRTWDQVQIALAQAARRKHAGRHADVDTAGRVDFLKKQRFSWPEIKEALERETGIHRTVSAYQNLWKRHFGATRKPTK